METNYQEIADLVARKCQEALAPLYAELEALQSHYGMRQPDPQPTPEEIEEAKFKKQLAEMKQMLIKSGRIPEEAKKNN